MSANGRIFSSYGSTDWCFSDLDTSRFCWRHQTFFRFGQPFHHLAPRPWKSNGPIANALGVLRLPWHRKKISKILAIRIGLYNIFYGTSFCVGWTTRGRIIHGIVIEGKVQTTCQYRVQFSHVLVFDLLQHWLTISVAVWRLLITLTPQTITIRSTQSMSVSMMLLLQQLLHGVSGAWDKILWFMHCKEAPNNISVLLILFSYFRSASEIYYCNVVLIYVWSWINRVENEIFSFHRDVATSFSE